MPGIIARQSEPTGIMSTERFRYKISQLIMISRGVGGLCVVLSISVIRCRCKGGLPPCVRNSAQRRLEGLPRYISAVYDSRVICVIWYDEHVP